MRSCTSSFTTLTKMGEACTMQSEFAERRWSQYMEMVKSKPKSDSGNQKEEKHAESKQFKQGIVIGSISALISSVFDSNRYTYCNYTYNQRNCAVFFKCCQTPGPHGQY